MNINDIIAESQHKCPHCGGPVFEYSELGEGKKDACYYKVKASAKVWPSAYASGRLVQCRQKGAANYGNKSEGVAEDMENNHWYNAGVKDATRGARPNPRTYLSTLKDKQAKHPEEVDFYMNGYKSVKQGVTEEWSKKYKSSINCSHPKGFSQKAHCAGKKKQNESIETEMTCPDCGMCETHGDHSKDNLDEACWKGYHKEGNKKMFGKTYPNCVKNTNEDSLNEFATGDSGGDDDEYDLLVKLVKMWWLGNEQQHFKAEKTLASMGISIDEDEPNIILRRGNQFLTFPMDNFQQGVAENFADGRNPQDKGDSKRHGINTKASVSSLRKTAKQGGRKGQLAHWLANMKAGRAKKEDVAEGGFISMRQKLGNIIKQAVQNDQAAYNASAFYQKLWGMYGGDIDAIIAERSIFELEKLARELIAVGKQGVTEAAHTTNFNDDDWYEINPDTKTIGSQRGPQAYQVPFGQRQIDLPNGNIVVRGMRAKGMGLDTGLDKPQQKEDGTWGAL